MWHYAWTHIPAQRHHTWRANRLCRAASDLPVLAGWAAPTRLLTLGAPGPVPAPRDERVRLVAAFTLASMIHDHATIQCNICMYIYLKWPSPSGVVHTHWPAHAPRLLVVSLALTSSGSHTCHQGRRHTDVHTTGIHQAPRTHTHTHTHRLVVVDGDHGSNLVRKFSPLTHIGALAILIAIWVGQFCLARPTLPALALLLALAG